jgi:hypothetical protein
MASPDDTGLTRMRWVRRESLSWITYLPFCNCDGELKWILGSLITGREPLRSVDHDVTLCEALLVVSVRGWLPGREVLLRRRAPFRSGVLALPIASVP